MSMEAAKAFLKRLQEDSTLMDDVLSRGTNREQRIAGMVELGAGAFSEADIRSAFAEGGLTEDGGSELSEAQLAHVAGGMARWKRWLGMAWDAIANGGGGGSNGGSRSATGVRG